MVALLDTWEDPVYLTRIWTIFEQFTATKLGINVEIILSKAVEEELKDVIFTGETGIERIKDSLCRVDSQNAKASHTVDEVKVKSLIEKSIGAPAVDAHVREVMIKFIGKSVESAMKSVVNTQQIS